MDFSLDDLRADIHASLKQSLTEIADEAVADLKKRASKPSPPASKAGEPPHMVTGEYVKSIKRGEVQGLQVEIYSDDPKAPYLEHGTENMAARPNFVPKAIELEEKVEEIISRNLSRDLGGSV
jgi:hypothetical protein